MNKYPRYHSFLLKLISFFLILSISGCGGEGSVGDAVPGDLIAGGGPHRLLGFVFDPSGQPIALAEVGGEDFTTWDGVTTGNFMDYQGGWIPIHALGYASSYAKAHAEEQGAPFFNATLTPYQDLVPLFEGEDATLTASHGDITWTAAVTASQFTSPEVVVGLAVLDPHYVDPRRVLFDTGSDLRLRTALAVEAFTGELSYETLGAGQVIELTLSLPSPLSDSAAFARFDPESGSWQVVDLGCVSGDGNLYTCQLDFLDPLIGLFDLPGSFSNTSGALLASRSLDAASDFDDAYNDYVDFLLDQEASGGGGGGSDQDSSTLDKLVEDLADSASNYASSNRTEGAKDKLGAAIQAALENGQDGLADQLYDEMGKIADELGEKALKESDCGEFEKLLKAAEQIQRTSKNTTLDQQLTDKAAEMAKDCDVWDGTITVWMPAVSTHPGGLPMQGGGGSWHERHAVKIWTNVDDHVMHGYGTISLSFPSVSYVKEKPCKQEIKMSGSGGGHKAVFEGFFDGMAFQVNTLGTEGSGGSIQQSWRLQKEQNDKCEEAYTQDFSMSPYYSVILHGLNSDSPLISYQEILDSAAEKATDKGIRSFNGNETFANPDPESGIYPYSQIHVQWRFMHTQWKLPIEGEY